MYMFKEQYEAYLRSTGYLSSISLLDVVPELLNEFDDLKDGLEEVKEQMVVMKNKTRAPRINWFCAVLTIINLVVLLAGILLVVIK